ncbi:MAG TPA: magnesium and cobalt transport protein [Chryseobacterium sp.]|nr:magnesium and cobalt transport protein [Chryseobacterium sp.]
MNIEVIFKNKTTKKINSVGDFNYNLNDVVNVQFINYKPGDIQSIEDKFHIDTAILHTSDDIEISSHFLETEDQISANFSVPFFDAEQKINEMNVCLINKEDTLFTFTAVDFEDILALRQKNFHLGNVNNSIDTNPYFVLIVGFVSDYFADLTEVVSKKVKNFYSEILKENNYSEKDLDRLTTFSFNNVIIEEAVNEYRRILHLFRKSEKLNSEIKKSLFAELSDLSVINEYIQNNFRRIDDLKENVSSKIELQQNQIFKTLTIVTMCISIPMLIAGIYGMNFKFMPELEWEFGYLYVLILIVFSFTLPIVWFKRKKWL